MRFVALASALAAATVVAADKPLYPYPYHFPLKNGFPEPSAKALKKIAENSGGAFPPIGGAFPTKVSAEAIDAFQLIGLNEIFEVGFFTELLKNVTHDVPGYKVKDKKYIMRALRRIRAQEEIHSLAVNALLEGLHATTIKPCKYRYPVKDFNSAIALANLFTDIVIAVVPGAQYLFAMDGKSDPQEPGLIPFVGSILAQEAQQDGWFRAVQGKPPSAAPFLTGTAPQFAAAALNLFIVPGSCPYLPALAKNTFPPLYVMTPAKEKTMTLVYQVQGTGISASKMSIVYMNGQNAPITEKISDVAVKDGITSFKATFPYDIGLSDGLTVAALVKGAGKKFASTADVADATLYGPGLIEVG